MAEAIVQAPLSDLPDLNLREDRGAFTAFVTDPATETSLRDGLTDAGCTRLDIRRGGMRVAVGTLRNSPTPRVLIVDVSDEADPTRALMALAEVAEPSVAVLVIGEQRDVDFYRELTRGLGVAEYLAKPLNRDAVARLFGPVVRGQAYEVPIAMGGRSVTITGATGGVGATTVAVNLAWQVASVHRRHTCLLDADLHMGTAALMMDMGMGPGLRSALQQPDRIDRVFLERTAELVAEETVDGRLSLLASEAPMSEEIEYHPGAAATLLDVMRSRYNVVIADAPHTAGPFSRDLLYAATQRVIVLEPSLAALRNTMRLLDMPGSPGAGQGRRPILVLNRLGRPGGLPRQQIETTLGSAVDVIIPELQSKVLEAANLGKPLVESNKPFQIAIDQLAQQLSVARPADVNRARRRERDVAGVGRFLRK